MVSYDDLSALVGNYPDLLILRRFGPLAAQVLLHLQAELLEINDDLEVVRKFEDQSPDIEKRQHCRSWAAARKDMDSGKGSDRLEKVIEAESKLLRYYKLVTYSSHVMRLEKPDRCDLDFLRSWLMDEKGGAHFLRRLPVEGEAWNESNNNDLIALNRRTDRFASWIMNAVLPRYHRWFGQYLHTQLQGDIMGEYYKYNDKHFIMASNLVCTTLSTALPSSSILVLYYVQSMAARLVIIFAFSLVLSLVMSFVSQGRRYEVFAATFAFAAVQVVFVGSVDTTASGSSVL